MSRANTTIVFSLIASIVFALSLRWSSDRGPEGENLQLTLENERWKYESVLAEKLALERELLQCRASKDSMGNANHRTDDATFRMVSRYVELSREKPKRSQVLIDADTMCHELKTRLIARDRMIRCLIQEKKELADSIAFIIRLKHRIVPGYKKGRLSGMYESAVHRGEQLHYDRN
jgi:hypothetical protein